MGLVTQQHCTCLARKTRGRFAGGSATSGSSSSTSSEAPRTGPVSSPLAMAVNLACMCQRVTVARMAPIGEKWRLVCVLLEGEDACSASIEGEAGGNTNLPVDMTRFCRKWPAGKLRHDKDIGANLTPLIPVRCRRESFLPDQLSTNTEVRLLTPPPMPIPAIQLPNCPTNPPTRLVLWFFCSRFPTVLHRRSGWG